MVAWPMLALVRGVGRRAGDAPGSEPFGDGADAGPGEELGEDPPDHCAEPSGLAQLARCRLQGAAPAAANQPAAP
jgi:hypothetical protein